MFIQPLSQNIQQNNRSQQTFKGNIQSLYKPIEGLKVFKGMTELDRRFLLAYVNCKPYMMGITTKEVDRLAKFDGQEFITKTADFIMDRLQIPKEIKPPIIFADTPSSSFMAYSPCTNILIIDMNKTAKLPKNDLFGLIRHEITHLQQNMSIFRHETVGAKAVEEYTKVAAKVYRQVLLENFEKNANMDVDKAISLDIIYPEQRYILDNAKKLYDQKDFNGYVSYVENEIAKVHKSELTSLREKIIETCGGIIPDGYANKQLEAGLNEFLNTSYLDKTTLEIDYNKYILNMLENEAILTQQSAEFEFSKSGCFIKHQKDLLQGQLNNPITRKFIESTIPD